jgi:xylan 1,4-beta-xylosidase
MSATERTDVGVRLPARPVVPGFHPDPSICRVGDSYYLATSSFEYAPGVPIFRSADLRSWVQIGHALDRPSQLDLSAAGPSGGIFAPTLRHHDGRFWMITTNATRWANLLVTATDAAGPWSEPVLLPGISGIDPDLAWDEDGRCYCTHSAIGATGHLGIAQSVVDPESGEVLTERRLLWQGIGGKFPEGPHLYRVGDLWYLLIAEGGTERGHAVTLARGPSPWGPWEACPANPLVTARGTDWPVQNTGHADLVQRPDGSWAMVFLGVRPRGGTPQWHVLGRETFAVEVVWEDGWPRVAGPIEPTDPPSALVTEALTGPGLPPAWVVAGRFPIEVLAWQDGGWTLTAVPGEPPVFAGRRLEHLNCRIQGVVDATRGTGGLELRIDPRHAVSLEVDAARVRAVARIGSVTAVLGEAAVTTGAVLELRTDVASDPGMGLGAGPDVVVAAARTTGGAVSELGRLDGRYLSTEVAGGFTGRMVGAWCSAGSVVVRSFSYTGSDSAEQAGRTTR